MFSWKSLVLHHQQIFVLMLQEEQDLSPNQHPQKHRGLNGATLLPPSCSHTSFVLRARDVPCPQCNIPKAQPCPSELVLGKEGGTDSSVCISIWVQEGFYIHPQGL